MRRHARLVCLALMTLSCGGRTADDLADASTDTPSDTFTDTSADTSADTPVDYGACASKGSCVVVPASCCGTCGAATPTDMVGVESSRVSAHRAKACGPIAGCPACYMRQDAFLQAFCTGGRCVAVNLRGDSLTGCETDADCQLRYASCCEPCDAPRDGLLALRVGLVSSYRDRVCPADAACPRCAVRYPDGARATCDATKHCTVVGLPPG